MINYQETDLDYQLCYDAHRGTSFVPEKRARQVIASYAAHMESLVAEFETYQTDQNREQLAADLERYRQTYITKYTALLHAKSRVMSAAITGPANFPTARNQKRANTEDKRREEFLAWQEKALKQLRQTYNPVIAANAPIASDDIDAIAKLQAKIEAAESDQEFMKAANRVIRSKKKPEAEKVAGLIKLGVNEKNARQLLETYHMGRAGFPAYQLTNNNANIRRMKQRLVALEAEAERGEVEDKQATINGTPVTIVENRDITRLQLKFEGKPPDEVRAILKSRGFNWSNREGAWQRLLNDNARRAAQELLD